MSYLTGAASVRSAILISLVFHLAAVFASTRIVRFARVRFVPRQVYSVRLFSLQETEEFLKKGTKAEESREPVVEKKQAEDEKMEPPSEPPAPKPRKKAKKDKRKKRFVPSSEVARKRGGEESEEKAVKESTEGQAVVGTVRLEVSDFPFGYYLATIRRKIASTWDVPQISRGESLRCRVYFRILKSGEIVSVEVEQSSPSFLFDRAAQRAVTRASPLPPLPDKFRDDYLGVHFSFTFEER